MSSQPRLSVVVPVFGQPATWPGVLKAMRGQTVADALELIVVTDAPETALLSPAEGGLCERVVPVRSGSSLREALTTGIQSATGEVVALAEDHAFPEPGWAEAIIAAHGEPNVVVGAAIANANPASSLSWANLLLGYGLWVPPVEEGEVDELPAAHSSFRRTSVLELGDGIAAMLGRDAALQRELRSRGHRLVLEPRAVVRHVNPSTLRATIMLRVYAGRLSAATSARRGDWSRARRLLYAVGSPLIPAVRFVRIVQRLRRRSHPLTPRLLGGLAVGTLLDGVGHLVGFVAGPGRAVERLERLEADRARLLSRRDRRALRA